MCGYAFEWTFECLNVTLGVLVNNWIVLLNVPLNALICFLNVLLNLLLNVWNVLLNVPLNA